MCALPGMCWHRYYSSAGGLGERKLCRIADGMENYRGGWTKEGASGDNRTDWREDGGGSVSEGWHGLADGQARDGDTPDLMSYSLGPGFVPRSPDRPPPMVDHEGRVPPDGHT